MHSTIYDFTEESDKFLCHELFISVKYDCNESNLLLYSILSVVENISLPKIMCFQYIDISQLYFIKNHFYNLIATSYGNWHAIVLRRTQEVRKIMGKF